MSLHLNVTLRGGAWSGDVGHWGAWPGEVYLSPRLLNLLPASCLPYCERLLSAFLSSLEPVEYGQDPLPCEFSQNKTLLP